MKELIEDIYGIYSIVACYVLAVLMILTSPLWIVPYAIKRKRGDK